MPGPLPKDPAIRQRMNKTVTRATLAAETGKRVRVPKLPDLSTEEQPHAWHPLTVAWWRDVWRSPMATEYLQADTHGLYRLAALVDKFWVEPNKDLAAEIRLEQQCFGLTPIDRRRLQWEVERVEAVVKQRQPQRAVSSTEPVEDVRNMLRVLIG